MVPKNLVPLDKWSPSNLVPMDKWSPTNLVPLDKRSPSNFVPLDKWSPKIWSSWTNGPRPIWSPYFQIITACPPGQTEYSRDHLSRGTKLVWDHLSRGPNFWGLNWLGTVCPEGPINWGPIVGDQMSLGPNVSQPDIIITSLIIARLHYLAGGRCLFEKFDLFTTCFHEKPILISRFMQHL